MLTVGLNTEGQFAKLQAFYLYHVGVAPWTEELALSEECKDDETWGCCIFDSFARPRTASVDLPKCKPSRLTKNTKLKFKEY
jgi:hypothetical protein